MFHFVSASFLKVTTPTSDLMCGHYSSRHKTGCKTDLLSYVDNTVSLISNSFMFQIKIYNFCRQWQISLHIFVSSLVPILE